MHTCNKLTQGAMATILGLAFSVSALAIDITGATFPYAVYAKWAEAYQLATGNKANYRAIGSSGGVKQIKGTIGYVDISDAMKNRMNYVALKNRAAVVYRAE